MPPKTKRIDGRPTRGSGAQAALARAARLVVPARKTADSLDAEVWDKLADVGRRAATLAISAVLQERSGAPPRDEARLPGRLIEIWRPWMMRRSLRRLPSGDPLIVRFCMAAIDAICGDGVVPSASDVQQRLRRIEDELLPLARQLCADRDELLRTPPAEASDKPPATPRLRRERHRGDDPTPAPTRSGRKISGDALVPTVAGRPKREQ